MVKDLGHQITLDLFYCVTTDPKGSNKFYKLKGRQFNYFPFQNWLLLSIDFLFFPFRNYIQTLQTI